MIVDGKRYTVTLVDLPCVIDTHKTLDRRTFYKSADIHQVRRSFLCEIFEDETLLMSFMA